MRTGGGDRIIANSGLYGEWRQKDGSLWKLNRGPEFQILIGESILYLALYLPGHSCPQSEQPLLCSRLSVKFVFGFAMIPVDMNTIHFYRPPLVIAKTNVFRPLQSIEELASACEHSKVKTIDSTDLSIEGRELDMMNENFKGPSNVPDEDDEFPSVEDLLAATEKSWLAEGVDYHNEGAVSGQMSPPSNDESFRPGNTIVFLSYDCSLLNQCPPLLMMKMIAFSANQLIDDSHQHTNFSLKIGLLRGAKATSLVTVKVRI